MNKPSDASVELLHEIAAALGKLGPVDIGTMFHNPGIRTGTKIVAFLGGDERLIVKVPRERAVALIDEGTATALSMGKRTMREWIAAAAGPDLHSEDPTRTLTLWSALAQESFDYVRSQMP